MENTSERVRDILIVQAESHRTTLSLVLEVIVIQYAKKRNRL